MNSATQIPIRQRIRKGLLLVSFLFFPLTLYWFSPALILQGASEGIINGSFMVFTALFVLSLFLGRFWCGWLCPAGALQDFGRPVNDSFFPGKKGDWIKWLIWTPWIVLIVVLTAGAGGFHSVDLFYQLEGGITVLQEPPPPWFVIYYAVLFLFLGLALTFGRRAGCHTLCWMAPFMITGRKIRNLAKWPALRLTAEPDKCIHCKTCTNGCPMSLDVNGMVNRGDMENKECVLCGTCVDHCPENVISYRYRVRCQNA